MSIEQSAALRTVAEPFVVVPSACLRRCGRLASIIVEAASPVTETGGLTLDREPEVKVVACHDRAITAILPFVCGASIFHAGSITPEGEHIGSVLRQGFQKFGKTVNGNTILQDAVADDKPILSATQSVEVIK